MASAPIHTRYGVRPHRRWLSLLSLVTALAAVSACGTDREPEDQYATTSPGDPLDTVPAGTTATTASPATTTTPTIAPDSRTVTAHLREWSVHLSQDTVPAGQVTFEAVNTGTRRHALEVEGQGIEEETDHIQPGQRATLTVDLRPGTYRVYCPVTDEHDHEAMGMVTTLVVR